MENSILKLKPQLLWKHFYQLTQIPRPTFHEEKVQQYLVNFAKEHGLECKVLKKGNVYLRKEATPGMEDREGLIFQAHQDMVAQCNKDVKFDFLKDPLNVVVENGRVRALGTTLGADNGIGLAAGLAIMEDDSIKHGPIEALFTVSEETGMVGAFNLEPAVMKGNILLNLDTETFGELCIGCAGAADASATFTYKTIPAPKQGYVSYSLFVHGLQGGHSGLNIVNQRANAIKLLFRFLYHTKIEILVANIDGGGLRNAIPREITAEVLIPKANEKKFLNEVKKYEKLLVEEFKGIEPKILMDATKIAPLKKYIPQYTISLLTRAILAVPSGVEKMSNDIAGLVETSNNLARVLSKRGRIIVHCMLRGSQRSGKIALAEKIKAIFEMAGAKIVISGSYDGWNPNIDSKILKTCCETFKRMYKKDAAVIAVHAGLECGIINGKYPNLDMISFGPTITEPHTPSESVDIASVELFYEFLTEIVENAPKK